MQQDRLAPLQGEPRGRFGRAPLLEKQENMYLFSSWGHIGTFAWSSGHRDGTRDTCHLGHKVQARI